MATELDSGGGSKRRRTGEGGERAHPGAEEGRISALPEALRLHILGLLPFKSAVRTGALSTRWRALWTHRWPEPSSVDLRLKTHVPPPSILKSLERRGRRRLDRFSLTFQIGKEGLKPDGVHRILDYAAACSVADLHVDFAHRALGFIFKLRLPRGDPHLTRLTVGGIRVGLSKPFSARSHTFSVLEVISLEGVTLSDHTVENLVAACPLLRTLDLRYCDGLDFVNVDAAGPHLRSLTVAECRGVRDISTREAPSLRSFIYSGSYIRALTIPATCALTDLYLCLGGPAGRLRPLGTPICFDFAWPAGVPRNWLQALTNLSNLTVLTLCSSALRRVSAKARDRSLAKNAVSCELRNLRELQLLMFAMDNSSVDDIYVFIVACCSPLLERLFVQLPTNSHYYRPGSEPSESEEELLEENGPVEDLWGEAPPEEELPEEEDEPQEELPEGELSEEEDELQEELPEGELSEEDELQDGLPERELSEEEDELQDELPEGEASEENQSEEDWSDEELSDGGHSEEEPVQDCLEYLKLLKMTSFKGGDNEMRLLRFVLRNSTSLNQLLLFTSKSDRPEWLQKDHLDTSDILQTKILPLQKALPNCQIILGESDGDAIQAFHREAFVDV